MKLVNALDKDLRSFKGQVNVMFAFHKFKMSQALKDFQSNVIKTVAFHLSNLPQITFSNYMATRLDMTLMREFDHLGRLTVARLQPQWAELRTSVDLMGRLFAGLVARKNQPPWMEVKINLADKTDEQDLDASAYYMKKLETLIINAINTGVKHEEPLQDIIKRIRKLFTDRLNIKESQQPRNYLALEQEEPVDETWQMTAELFDKPPVQVSEGAYTLEDVEALQLEQKAAMNWYHREYRPNMDETIWARNQAFMAFEQDLMRDTVTRLHQGMLKIGDDNMGIKDFKWVVSFPQKECDSCTERDGMTMTEISKKYGSRKFAKGDAWPPELKTDSPPPLHPNCRCQLVPALQDEWADTALEKKGWKWNQESGETFNPSAEQRKLGFTKMTWDQWLNNVGSSDAS